MEPRVEQNSLDNTEIIHKFNNKLAFLIIFGEIFIFSMKIITFGSSNSFSR